jgi:4,5-dihydroxyphthalate decarboxylase
MADLRLTLVARPYDRLMGLINGVVRPRGIQLTFVTGMPVDLLDQIARGDADLGEVSMGQYTDRRARDVDDVVALPVFPLRMFRQGDAYVRKGSELESMARLAGKRVGLEGYCMSSNIWTRGILQHELGVPPSAIEWFEGRTDAGRQCRLTPLGSLPADVRLTAIGEDRTTGRMLLDGELDAIFPSWPPVEFRPDGPIERLYPNYPQEDRRYYARTGLWPIQHTIAIRRQILRDSPWVAESLITAFDEATRYWKERLREHHSMLPWTLRQLEEAEQLFGQDLYGNGLSASNVRNVEAFLSYAHEQGVAARKVSLDEFFAPGG